MVQEITNIMEPVTTKQRNLKGLYGWTSSDQILISQVFQNRKFLVIDIFHNIVNFI